MVQAVQDGVRQEGGDQRVAGFGVAQHGVIAHLVPVLEGPVVGIVFVLFIVHVAAQFADGVAVHRFDGVVVQLHPIIADGPGDRAPAAEFEVILHLAARSVQPFDAVGKGRVDVAVLHLGAVDAEFPIVGVEGEKRLDPPTLVPILRGGHEVLFGHGGAGPVHHPARAEDAPCDDDAIGVLIFRGGEEAVERAVAVADGEKLVGIEDHDPVGVADDGFFLRVVQRRGLRADAFGNDVAAVVGEAEFFQPYQHVVGAVRAVVGIDHEIGEADGEVMGDPFDDVRPLVLHHRDGGDLAVGADVALHAKGDGAEEVRCATRVIGARGFWFAFGLHRRLSTHYRPLMPAPPCLRQALARLPLGRGASSMAGELTSEVW